MNDNADGKIKITQSTDIDLLSGLFVQLSEDEASDIERNAEEYRALMEGFLERGDKAYVFTSDDTVIGYALVIMEKSPLYIRHFYICRNARRSGCGTRAFRLLQETLQAKELDLDVFVWNERGKAFWNSLGFAPRALIMRFKDS